MLRIWALSYLWLALNVSYSLVYLFSTFLVVLEQCTFCQGKRYVSLLKVSTLFLKHAIIKGYCEFIVRLPFIWGKNNTTLWSQIRQDYPLNLSISVSGGKETNKDSPSNGEWRGKSSNLKSERFPFRIVVWRSVFCGHASPSFLGIGHQRGWESRLWLSMCYSVIHFLRVGLFGNAALNGW
jgi:hypothetical protein